MNLAPIGVWYIFGEQYIMERVLSCSVILSSHFSQYLTSLLVIFSLNFCACEYVDVDFFLSGETSANSLEM